MKIMSSYKMPLRYNFIYDFDENEWDREDLNLCLIEIHKMDMYESIWVLSKFDDLQEEGEYILFRGLEDEMSYFIKEYIRNNKLDVLLDGSN